MDVSGWGAWAELIACHGGLPHEWHSTGMTYKLWTSSSTGGSTEGVATARVEKCRVCGATRNVPLTNWSANA